MDARISFVTLVVGDLQRSRAFYVDGLGWSVELDVPDAVCMIRTGEKLMLSLWQREAAAAELGPIAAVDGTLPFTLAHNVDSPAAVDAVLATVAAAGGAIVAMPTLRDWGGYSGYFADPDGFRWEVAYNPTPLGEMVL